MRHAIAATSLCCHCSSNSNPPVALEVSYVKEPYKYMALFRSP